MNRNKENATSTISAAECPPRIGYDPIAKANTSTGLPHQSLKVDCERLFKLRLAVARHGEMDGARWWNTQGVLGRRGGVVLKRGFPTTHRFAQARIVFDVAKSRCHELFDPPGCMTTVELTR